MPSSIFVNDDDDDDKPTKFEFLKCLPLSIPEIEGGPKFRKLATFTRHMLVRNLKKNRSCDPNQPPPKGQFYVGYSTCDGPRSYQVNV